jgi:hypothetical protein
MSSPFATLAAAAAPHFRDTYGEPVIFEQYGEQREIKGIVDLRPDRTVYPLDQLGAADGNVWWDTITVNAADVEGWLTVDHLAEIRGEQWAIAGIDPFPETAEIRIRIQELRAE